MSATKRCRDAVHRGRARRSIKGANPRQEEQTNSAVGFPAVATSIESAAKLETMALCLRERVRALAQKARSGGLTVNEAERQISDYKQRSIGPRFRELERDGELVRVIVSSDRPSKRFPNGLARYVTRYDEETNRNVNVYWVPEFAPESFAEGEGRERNNSTDSDACVAPEEDGGSK